MTADLGARVALVTGGGNGIGRATALALGARDASVVVADVDETAAAETAELIGAVARTAVVRADVADAASVEKMVAFAVERVGALDFACNVAGVSGEQKPFTDHTLAEWQRVINIDLTGVFLCMQHELRQMVTQGRGQSSTSRRPRASCRPRASRSTRPPSTACSVSPSTPRRNTLAPVSA